MRILKLCTLCMFTAAALACATANQSNSAANNTAAANAQASPAVDGQTSRTPAAVADGRSLYKDNCAACHRETGKGGKIEIEGKRINPDDLTSAKIKGFSDDKIAGYIRNGVEDEGMPAFKDKLDDKQIAAVIEYIRTDLQKTAGGL